MTGKNLGYDAGTQFLQIGDYQYNIRGWLTDINTLEDSCTAGGGDVVPPGPITDLWVRTLTPDPGYNLINLSWTTTGEDGTLGAPAHYRVMWMVQEITEENVDTLSPGTPYDGYGWGFLYPPSYERAGSRRSISINGFQYFYPPGTVYYFAIEAVDEAGNSSLSNVVRMAIGTERTGTTISTPSLKPGIQPGKDLFRLKLYYNETFAIAVPTC